MNYIKITAQDKNSLELRHKSSRDPKERDRIKAILLYSEGWTIAIIAQALRIHQSSVLRHLEDYTNGKLTISSGGSDSILDESQTKELIEHLELHTYQSTKEIVAYVQETYNITYIVPGINKWLHRNGFRYKKPKGYPHKANKAQQEKFINEYNNIKQAIKPTETTASRTRINLIGALNLNKVSNPIIASYSTIDSERIVDFLKQIRNHAKVKGKINLILDRAGYHCTNIVKNTARKLNIKLFYLPPYSPNLNPIERLWKVMNEHARNNTFFKTADHFRESIFNFFRQTIPKIGNILNARINDRFQKLNYAF
jgi:transposase